MIIAFATTRNYEIRPLAMSFAYVMLVICALRIVMPFMRSLVNLSYYMYILSAVYLLPSVFVTALFHKMVAVSGSTAGDEIKDKRDLL